MPYIRMPYTVQLDNTLRVTPISTLFAMGDSNAHRFELTIRREGSQESLAGCTVSGKFYRISENAAVDLKGTVEDGKAVVVLNKSCYDYIGRFALTITVKDGVDETTVFYGDGYMHGHRIDTVITGEYIIYDINMLLQKIAEIDAATSAANDAAQNANAAASDATTAADTANTAAGSATSAASRANAAAAAIEGITATATALGTGEAATAAVQVVDGHYVLALGLPRGLTGATPQITLQVATGAPGTDATIAEQEGSTAENPHYLLTIPRGDVGNIGNLKVNGKTPGGDGSVSLTAQDVGARPDDWMPNAQDVGAVSMELLWENAGPSSAMNADADGVNGIELDWATMTYTHVLVTFAYGTKTGNRDNITSAISEIVIGKRILLSTTNAGFDAYANRALEFTDGGLHIGGASSSIAGTKTNGTASEYIIPLKVYGIKGVRVNGQ